MHRNLEIDAMLRVRLCGPCYKTNLIVWDTVAPVVKPLIPFSGRITPPPYRPNFGCSNAFVLREDVPGITAKYESKKKLNEEALKAWVKERWAIKDERLQHAQMLGEFLNTMEMVHEQEVEDTKAD
ncbi:unnamed protein product [Rhizoctonia solani]|uniref:Uncharacterized protein n=1 Tax=Rhizoctonia solani TaxID=456999 RepID=A0A8H3H7G5_9AGAM|nr:unnamed protein product [Rhizoctonia solani]